jgi:hypothetical protein
MAAPEPMSPSFMLRIMNGFLINDFVAPTICMVLMIKRLECMDNLSELLMSKTAINDNMALPIS